MREKSLSRKGREEEQLKRKVEVGAEDKLHFVIELSLTISHHDYASTGRKNFHL
jgi:hypothetical protein